MAVPISTELHEVLEELQTMDLGLHPRTPLEVKLGYVVALGYRELAVEHARRQVEQVREFANAKGRELAEKSRKAAAR